VARARNIKPSFFSNDDLADVDPLGRILFIGLWTVADREGRLEDRPRRIKAEVLPYDICDVDSLLSDLEKHGFILRYASGDDRFIQVLNFTKHQNPHVKESSSTIPAPGQSDAGSSEDDQTPAPITNTEDAPAQKDPMKSPVSGEHQTSPVQEQGSTPPLPEQAGLIPDSLLLIPDSPSLNPDCGNQRERKPSPPAAQPSPTLKTPKALRLPTDWKLPEEWESWALKEQPSWTRDGVLRVADSFRDYWTAKGGADARKVDWQATWRNWVRRENAPGLRAVPIQNRQEALEARNREVAERFARGA